MTHALKVREGVEDGEEDGDEALHEKEREADGREDDVLAAGERAARGTGEKSVEKPSGVSNTSSRL